MINISMIIGLSLMNFLILYCIRSRYNIKTPLATFNIILGLGVNLSAVYYIVDNLTPSSALITSIILVGLYTIIFKIMDSKLGVRHND